MRTAIAAGMLVLGGLAGAPAAQGPAPETTAWDTRFRALPDTARLKASMRRMSARPHHVGSPYGKEVAEWIASEFRSYGWQTDIESFDVLFPTPKERLLEMIAPTTYRAHLDEPAVEGDPTSTQADEQLPTYNAYSRDGDVTGPLVYVNYGRPQDYEVLDRYGVSVKGAIVIARYGASWRGIKPKVAAEKGAIGCIIYSDPRDDGYFQGDVFPKGPMRPPRGVQRGSVMDMPTYPGDPLTPGVGATSDARRLDRADAATITKIPVLPISYADAQPLLAALEGRMVPTDWRGALPITYRFGPGPATVHLKVAFNWDIKRLNNVIARIPGSAFPDEWVLRGNHHDAWVNGAEDPVSGMAAVLEEARAMGELLRHGWKPKRTIVYAAWDGEEPALLGSTEWVEQHDADLREHAVAYVNTDGTGRGLLDAGGSHSLEALVNGVARDVTDPEAGISVWKRLQASRIAEGTEEERKAARERRDLRIDALGSGSDFTPFLQHNGVPTLNLSFSGEDEGGIYHSIYDDFFWYTQFSDREFLFGRALAQTVGSLVIRLADADLLPFDFTAVADRADAYTKELQKLLETRQKEIAEQNRQIEDGVFAAINDPLKPLAPPRREEVPPALNFAPLLNASTRLEHAATRYRKAREAAEPRLASKPDVVRRVNALLIQSERQLLDPAGLPDRPWYRHLLYAPGYYTGYSVKTVPGVREGIEQKKYAGAEAEIVRAAAALDRESALVTKAAEALEAVR
jgi:N-acetylated-alpha-linked acidic dipeptidase